MHRSVQLCMPIHNWEMGSRQRAHTCECLILWVQGVVGMRALAGVSSANTWRTKFHLHFVVLEAPGIPHGSHQSLEIKNARNFVFTLNSL